MVHNNKVLTVSYGTFSCTLEGFEDSFGTMKAIAEYFRDLASDDRYFGAEPPQPDADMLARIAQREIARQVEARTSDGGIHLRAASALTAPATEAPAPTPAPAPAPVEPAAQEQAPVEDQQPASPATEHPAAAYLASELPAQTLAPAPPAAEPAAEAEPEAELAADVATEAEPTATEAEAEVQEVTEAETDIESESEAEDTIAAVLADTNTPAPQAEADEADEAEDVPAEADSAGADTADADSIAAKLQRIRAVVARSPEQDFSEDEHAEDVLADAAEDITAALEHDDTATDLEDDSDDEIARALDRLDLASAAADRSAPEADAAPDAATDTVADTEAEPVAQTEAEAEPEAAAEPAPEPAAATPGLRIAKVKRADFERAVAEGQLEDTSDTDDLPDDTAERAADALSDEDEADLMRELAAVEAEILAASDPSQDEIDSDIPPAAEAQPDPQPEIAPEIAPETAPETAAEAHADPQTMLPADSDVSRLMAAADEKLGEPESTSSREAYSHLRAAAAAAKNGSADGSDDDDAQPYREDLASVVRPRRPETRPSSSERPRIAVSRPAPLKLVAAQRISEGSASDSKPASVRPRRVSASVLDDSGDTNSSGFADYASERGAAELHELLEAAAAYLSFVEGRDHFSRPQLMNKVRSTGTSEFNREDGLRSFGQLLREGKIERSGNGKFTASGEIGFQPDKRAAG